MACDRVCLCRLCVLYRRWKIEIIRLHVHTSNNCRPGRNMPGDLSIISNIISHVIIAYHVQQVHEEGRGIIISFYTWQTI